jgi:hypothetical protein
MAGLSITGLLVDYSIALPFAIGLALYNQVLQRPSFHLAGTYAAAPLVTAAVWSSVGPLASIAFGFLFCLLATAGLDAASARLSASARKRAGANAFLVSIAVYLILAQMLMMMFGAAPKSFRLSGDRLISAGDASLPLDALVASTVSACLAIVMIVALDSRVGDKLRFSAGEALDVAHAGVSPGKYRFIAVLIASSLVIASSLARAVLVPFSVYSGFVTFILCYCAAAGPRGSRLALAALLLAGIFVPRAFVSFYFSANLADALTLASVLAAFTAWLSASAFRLRS